MAALIIEREGALVLQVPLDRRLTSVGAAPGNDIQLPDPAVAPFQLAITQARHGHRLIDQTGTGLPTPSRSDIETLRDGATWKLGPYTLRYDTGVAGDATETLASVRDRPKAPAAALVVDGKRLSISTQGTTIGARQGCDLVISETAVSGMHCRIFARDGRFHIRDLDSTNGTYVDGKQVVEAELPARCTISVGRRDLLFSAGEAAPKNRPPSFYGMVGRSAPMKALFGSIERCARTDATVLIHGETGSGKELVARAIHLCSARAKGPYHPLNCGAIPTHLVESELFGHEKGAFTGATARRRGAFEVASSGTLFLDEVAELPRDVQAALLRVLDSGEVRRVGAEKAIAADARLLAATHRDLGRAVAAEEFRQDLLYRLQVLVIVVPPLRDRIEDIPDMVAHLLAALAPSRPMRLSDAALRLLTRHSWPGNVRELRNTLQRCLVFAGGDVVEADDVHILDPTVRPLQDAITPLADIERAAIVRALRLCHGNKKATAKRLGIDRTTLHRKLHSHTIAEDEYT